MVAAHRRCVLRHVLSTPCIAGGRVCAVVALKCSCKIHTPIWPLKVNVTNDEL